MYVKHNDYEIIDQVRQGNQDALSLMFDKYKNLISKKIVKFNLVYEYEDMMQEGLMVLHKSITKYDDSRNKSFTRFFELNLDRYFISLVSKRVRRNEIFRTNEIFIYENNHSINHNSVYYELYKKEIAKILTKQEFLVYTLRELCNFSISYIKEEYSIPEKKIYNTLHRAKVKIKAHFSN